MKKKIKNAARKAECLLEGLLIAGFVYVVVLKRAIKGEQ